MRVFVHAFTTPWMQMTGVDFIIFTVTLLIFVLPILSTWFSLTEPKELYRREDEDEDA